MVPEAEPSGQWKIEDKMKDQEAFQFQARYKHSIVMFRNRRQPRGSYIDGEVGRGLCITVPHPHAGKCIERSAAVTDSRGS